MDKAEVLRISPAQFRSGHASPPSMKRIDHQEQVITTDLIHQCHPLLKIAHASPRKELYIVVQSIPFSHLSNFPDLLGVVALVPGPDASQNVSPTQTGSSLKCRLILTDL